MASEVRIDRLEGVLGRLAEAQVQTEAAVRTLAEVQARTEVQVGRLEEVQARTEVRVGRLEEAVARLAEAQARTEVRVGRLEEAQARTEVRVGRLEEAVARLAEAQARTEVALQQLTRQVGGLNETVGGDIEDIAYIVLHDVLRREFGWEVGVLERTWQEWDGEAEEVDVFGQATDPAQPERPIWIVGEAKHNLTLREVERFARQAERARRHLDGQVYVVCFCYRARPEVRTRLRELGISLLFSYGRFA
jgi:predicted nuclease with TOPRIM domain